MGENNCTIKMIDWACCQCGCYMKMPKELNESLVHSHETFYCVMGHTNYYPKKTKVEKMEKKLATEIDKNLKLEQEIKRLKRTFWDKIF